MKKEVPLLHSLLFQQPLKHNSHYLSLLSLCYYPFSSIFPCHSFACRLLSDANFERETMMIENSKLTRRRSFFSIMFSLKLNLWVICIISVLKQTNKGSLPLSLLLHYSLPFLFWSWVCWRVNKWLTVIEWECYYNHQVSNVWREEVTEMKCELKKFEWNRRWRRVYLRRQLEMGKIIRLFLLNS